MRCEFRRSFSARHPLFRDKATETGIWWEESAYYLWWEYLRRHDGYRQTCLKSGKGLYAQLYRDFGDVHGSSFKEWWREGDLDRGVALFSEPLAPVGIMALTDAEALELIGSGRDERTLLVAIPLDYRRRSITQAINKILKESLTRKPGQKRVQESKARYPLAMVPDVYALSITLKCYDLRQEYPDLPLWRIAELANVGRSVSDAIAAKKDVDVAAMKASLTAGVSRKLRHANSIIEGVSRGVFPTR